MSRTKYFLCLVGTLSLFAQTPADNLFSPDVHPDRTVTFNLNAPKASDVAFYGDWMPVGTKQAMTRNAAGNWTITVGPIEPSIYIYNFIVDGITIADPINPRMKLRSRTSASLVEVPAATPAIWQIRDVPHGAVEINWQKSSVLGDTRAIWIYTPPGYEKKTAMRFPVLYLLHGSNDTAAGWVTAGNANFIIDNLIAEKKAAPMVVVMPYTHAVPFGSPRELQAKNTQLFDEYLTKDLMPFVAAKYRIAAGSSNHALAGLSMGGGHSLFIGLSRLGLFDAVAVFSSAPGTDFETRFAKVLNDPAGTNKKLKLFWIGCGRQDTVFDRATKLSSTLTSHGIKHTFRATEGAHTYTVWRAYLAEFAPLLFK